MARTTIKTGNPAFCNPAVSDQIETTLSYFICFMSWLAAPFWKPEMT